MKAISVHVPEGDYLELKSLAAQTGRPVAEHIRQAMAEYLEHQRRRRSSIFDLEPHASGPLLRGWTRAEILDEMLERRDPGP